MNKITVLSKDVFSNYTSISPKSIMRGVVELTREKFPIEGLTIYEAFVGNLLLSEDNTKETIDNAKESLITITLNNGTVNNIILPKKDFIDIFNIDEIKQCNSQELEIIRNYHIKHENYELLSKIF